jgi:hypothetical protein
MDAETIRLIVTATAAVVAGLGGAALTAVINRKNTKDTLAFAQLAADDQRSRDENAWRREHLAAAYADAHKGIFALQAYIVSAYQYGPNDAEAVRTLGGTADSAISRLVFLAEKEVTQAAIESRVLCRKLHRIAKSRVEDADPTANERWEEMNGAYVESMKRFTGLASNSLTGDARHDIGT